MMALAILIGEGSLLLFGVFLIIGPITLLRNMLWTLWITLGSYLEEKDLVAEFGESYRHYQNTVPMLVPWRFPDRKTIKSH